jgi:hypothetical protein
VVSKGFEAKDLEFGPPFYLSQGVKDVIVFDPLTLLVLHVRRDKTPGALTCRPGVKAGVLGPDENPAGLG